MADKQKAESLQARLGFSDPELKTPKHDAIMLWLDKEAKNIAKNFGIEKKIICSDQQQIIVRLRQGADKAVQNAVKEEEQKPSLSRKRPVYDLAQSWTGLSAEVPEVPEIRITKVWEKPIMSDKYIVGFVDMSIEAVNEEICIQYNLVSDYREQKLYLPRWSTATTGFELLIEVKPSIVSVGELIRQIRMYQQYIKSPRFFSNFFFMVVSPDDRFADILKGQGIYFVKCPD